MSSYSVQGQLADEAVGGPEPAAVVVPGAGRRVQVQVRVHTADTALAPPDTINTYSIDIIYNYIHTIRPEVVGLAGCPGGEVHLGSVGPEPAALLLVGSGVVPVAAQPEHAATGRGVIIYLLSTRH